MKKKTLFWILGIVIVTLVVLVGGKKAGMFGKTKRGKEVEIAKITPIDITRNSCCYRKNTARGRSCTFF